MTRDEIIAAALDLAGDTELSAQAVVWLNAWHRDASLKWAWPHLKQRLGPLSVGAGAGSFELGNGSGGVAEEIQYLLRLYWADAATLTAKTNLWVNDAMSSSTEDEPEFVTISSTGRPYNAVVESTATRGRWKISFEKLVTNEALRLMAVAKVLPGNLAAADVPVYPNDETMIQAVYVRALKHQNDERWTAEEATLQRMVREDRVALGARPGSSKIQLSRRRFRRR